MDKKYCRRCGRELSYRELYNYGDPNFGIAYESWHCPFHGKMLQREIMNESDFQEE